MRVRLETFRNRCHCLKMFPYPLGHLEILLLRMYTGEITGCVQRKMCVQWGYTALPKQPLVTTAHSSWVVSKPRSSQRSYTLKVTQYVRMLIVSLTLIRRNWK